VVFPPLRPYRLRRRKCDPDASVDFDVPLTRCEEPGMAKMKGLFLTGTILLSSVFVVSQTHPKEIVVSDVHGTELLRMCATESASAEAQFCYAFILGVRDGVVLTAELRGTKPIIETPVEAKQEQLKAIVVKYLKDHPEEHHKPAAMLVIFALSQAFPPQDKAAR